MEKKLPTVLLGFFLVMAIVFEETLLCVGVGVSSSLHTFLYVLLSAMALGGVLFFFAVLPRKKVLGRIFLIIALVLIALFFGIQYYCKGSFKNYMAFSDIAVTAQDVAGDYAGVIINLIKKTFYIPILLLLPVILLPILLHANVVDNRHIKMPATLIPITLAALCVVGDEIYVRQYADDYAAYGSEYEFDVAVGKFGLLMSTGLDIRYLCLGNNEATAFVFDDEPYELNAEGQNHSEGDTAGILDENQEGQSAENQEQVAHEIEKKQDDGATSKDDKPGTSDKTEPATPKVYEPNALDIDFATLAQSEPNKTIASIDEYVASVSPSMKNDMTGLMAGKNLILITAEALSREAISEELTPTLYKMMTHGVYFSDYYQPAWGGSTSSGECSVITGIVPAYGVTSILKTADHNNYWTLGNQLQRQDYFSRSYHNNTYTYYNRDLTHENIGYSKFIAYGNGLEGRITHCWPESDLEMMQVTIDDYINNQPFSVYYMSVSGHCNYNWHGNAMAKKNQEYVENLDCSETIKCYLGANLEFEHAMSYLLERLDEAGILDDTLIVISPDHYPYGLEHSEAWENEEDYLAELYGYAYSTVMERDHSVCIMYSGAFEDMELSISAPSYSLDIVPTVSNLMGLPFDSRMLVGRDVFSNAEPLVVWGDHSWKTDKAQFNAHTKQLTVFEGYEERVSDEYVKRIKKQVNNKIAYSKNVLDIDYFGAIFGPDEYK